MTLHRQSLVERGSTCDRSPAGSTSSPGPRRPPSRNWRSCVRRWRRRPREPADAIERWLAVADAGSRAGAARKRHRLARVVRRDPARPLSHAGRHSGGRSGEARARARTAGKRLASAGAHRARPGALPARQGRRGTGTTPRGATAPARRRPRSRLRERPRVSRARRARHRRPRRREAACRLPRELLEAHGLAESYVATNTQIALAGIHVAGADAHAGGRGARARRAAERAGTTEPLARARAAAARIGTAQARRLRSPRRKRSTPRAPTSRLLPDPGMLSALAERVDAELSAPPRHEGFYGEPLSEAELRVLSLLVAGRSVSDVAHELFLAPTTVKTHRRTIYRKLGVTNREEAIARAAELDLVVQPRSTIIPDERGLFAYPAARHRPSVELESSTKGGGGALRLGNERRRTAIPVPRGPKRSAPDPRDPGHGRAAALPRAERAARPRRGRDRGGARDPVGDGVRRGRGRLARQRALRAAAAGGRLRAARVVAAAGRSAPRARSRRSSARRSCRSRSPGQRERGRARGDARAARRDLSSPLRVAAAPRLDRRLLLAARAVGYIHGVAVVLVIGQLGKLLGLSIDGARAAAAALGGDPELGERQRRDGRASRRSSLGGAVRAAALRAAGCRRR